MIASSRTFNEIRFHGHESVDILTVDMLFITAAENVNQSVSIEEELCSLSKCYVVESSGKSEL